MGEGRAMEQKKRELLKMISHISEDVEMKEYEESSQKGKLLKLLRARRVEERKCYKRFKELMFEEGIDDLTESAVRVINLLRTPACSVDEEPGMIGLEVKAGDAIIFTENLLHGGLTNQSDQVRKTLHVGYGPAWMMSQNISSMDEVPYIKPETWNRYDQGLKKNPEQKRWFHFDSPYL